MYKRKQRIENFGEDLRNGERLFADRWRGKAQNDGSYFIALPSLGSAQQVQRALASRALQCQVAQQEKRGSAAREHGVLVHNNTASSVPARRTPAPRAITVVLAGEEFRGHAWIVPAAQATATAAEASPLADLKIYKAWQRG